MGIFDIFKIKRTIKRSYLTSDEITSDEWEYLNKYKCPDCDAHPYLWEGPSGGASTNYECIGESEDIKNGCGSKFNLAIEFGWGQRLNDNKGRLRQDKIDNILNK